MDDPAFSSGSRWHRWEPHVHAPGTVLNDQFSGADAWERYLQSVEATTPVIHALGVADYYSTRTYDRVREAKRSGRLPQCMLIFPNIEMRLAIGTIKGKWVNVHLLVSPDEANHVAELNRFVARLTFNAYDDTFSCTEPDLTRLGMKTDPKITDPRSALKLGSEQFKVSFDQLRAIYKESSWAQQNILIAVAGGETDGTSGIRDAADATLRQEVEKFAHVIFASSVAQREFWLGRRSLSDAEIRARYGSLKPCMHGSDAHAHEHVGLPAGDRFSWLKGAVAFDTLRQACIDPEGRAWVGFSPPPAATGSQVIAKVSVGGAHWFRTSRIALNPGLVAIIGARGSGKTALADVIGLGCDAIAVPPSPASFLARAQDLLSGSSVTLTWETGDEQRRYLDAPDSASREAFPRARYLSQQFVEELCTANGITDALLAEIERVIFEAHPSADRDCAIDFNELLELRVSRFRLGREREEECIVNISERIGNELDKTKTAPIIRKQVQDKEKLIAGYARDRARLVSKGSEARMERLTQLSEAADKVRAYLRYFKTQEQSLLALDDDVANFRRSQAPEALRRTEERFKASGLKGDDWKAFLLDFSGDVSGVVSRHLTQSRKSAKEWTGEPPPMLSDTQTSYIPEGSALDRQPLTLLETEITRLQRLINVDREMAAKFASLSKRVTEETTALTALKERLADCEGAKERATGLVAEREAAYSRVFESIVDEVSVLTTLYEPLLTRLRGASGTLGKLSFSVHRDADVGRWAAAGEELFDLRHSGHLKGQGRLRELGELTLMAAWERGDPHAATIAMRNFRSDHQEELLDRASVSKADVADYRAWLKRFAKWLYSTEHIVIRYSIDYDGVDIRKLSPGTRGIVLLLLYLALDDGDDRPLIIDQPEESLDPKSVFDELVKLFVAAKQKRQVVIVTHNANLVVNTDADQIIVARAGPHAVGELPPLTYQSGGLEEEEIRKAVCDILEGGEDAFRERARRLRVALDR